MNVRTMSFVMTSLLLSGSAALALQACSSSTTGDNSTADASTGGGQDSGSEGTVDGSTQPGVDGGTQPGVDGSTPCASPPKLFVPKADGGMYCPFSKNPDGGVEYCKTPAEMCCLSPSADAGSSVCEKLAASCTNTAFSQWECSSPSECAGNAGGNTCCLIAGPLEADLSCSGYQKTKGFDATKCMAAAACTGTVVVGKFTDNQTIVCEQQSDCAGGKTCTPVKTTGTSIGLCL